MTTYKKAGTGKIAATKGVAKLRWQNLLSGNCPKCNHRLIEYKPTSTLICAGPYCRFSISEDRCAEVLRSLSPKT
jgi:hypothetical protein